MKTSPAACDLEAAAATAAQQPQAPARAAKKVTQEEVADPRLRSPFVRTVYAILSLQFALTSAIAATAYFVRPVQRFFADGPPAAVVPAFAVILASPQFVCEVIFRKLEDGEKRPRNLVLIALVTVYCSLTLVLSAFTTDVDIAFLQAAILIVLGLTLCTIWAAKRDLNYDHSNTFAALLTSIVIAPLAYTIVAIPFPLKMVGIAICGFLVTLVLSGFYVVTCESCDSLAFSTTTATTMYNGGGDGSEVNGDNHRV